jgi:hypothetical protein
MGAIVTVKVKPGTDISGLREKIESRLRQETNENVSVIINVTQSPSFDRYPFPSNSDYYGNQNK